MRERGSTGLTARGAPEQGRRGALGQERGDRRRSLRHTASDRGGATGLPQGRHALHPPLWPQHRENILPGW